MTFASVVSSTPLAIFDETDRPGLIVQATKTPNTAANVDEQMKYNRVRYIILPLIRPPKSLATVIMLDISSGNINNLNIRINNSPGYEINRICSVVKSKLRNKMPKDGVEMITQLIYFPNVSVCEELFLSTNQLMCQ